MSTRRLFVLAATMVMLAASPVHAQDKSIVVASTSRRKTPASRPYPALFKAKTGIDVKVVAQDTRQALDTGRRGDADVLFVHAKPQEEKFIADGAGVKRTR